MIDVHGGQHEHAFVELPDDLREPFQKFCGNAGIMIDHVPEGFRRHGADKSVIQGQHVCRTRFSVDRCKFAEDFSGADIDKGYLLAQLREIDGADVTLNNEKDIGGVFKLPDDLFPWRDTLPVAAHCDSGPVFFRKA
jgi:hypothetical protein